MNALLRNTIATKGLDNALEVAKVLIKNDYQVMIQLDDCDIYVVAYESNDPTLGDNQFASLTQAEVEHIYDLRHDGSLRDLSPEEAKEIVDDWLVTEDDDAYIDQSADWHR